MKKLYKFEIILEMYYCCDIATLTMFYRHLPYDVESGGYITPCIKIDKPLVVNSFGNVMQ